MEDIAIFTGGEYVCEEVGIHLDKNAENPETLKATLGVAKSVTVTKDDTIIMNGEGSK